MADETAFILRQGRAPSSCGAKKDGPDEGQERDDDTGNERMAHCIMPILCQSVGDPFIDGGGKLVHPFGIGLLVPGVLISEKNGCRLVGVALADQLKSLVLHRDECDIGRVGLGGHFP